jgi:hypothetical protein
MIDEKTKEEIKDIVRNTIYTEFVFENGKCKDMEVRKNEDMDWEKIEKQLTEKGVIFQLCTVEELEKYCPWFFYRVLNGMVKVKDAVVDFPRIVNTPLNYLHWKSGEWINGNFKYGKWYDGTFWNGTIDNMLWVKGTMKNCIFKDGVWEGGTWVNGIWKEERKCTGRFYNATF